MALTDITTMPDPNPYESPKSDQPLKPVQVAKRATGLATILLLTPPAMIIATDICCTNLIFPAAGSSLSLVPWVILVALMGWAAWLVYKHPRAGRSSRRPIEILLWTPFAVFAATFASFGIAYAVGHYSQGVEGFGPVVATWVITFGLPGATLVAMLWQAWRTT